MSIRMYMQWRKSGGEQFMVKDPELGLQPETY